MKRTRVRINPEVYDIIFERRKKCKKEEKQKDTQ